MENIEDILKDFEKLADNHANYTEEGDYKKGNKEYDKIIKIVAHLKKHDAVDKLLPLLDSSSVGARVFAATYLLSSHEEEALKVLEEANNLNSETIIKEWKAGRLIPYFGKDTSTY